MKQETKTLEKRGRRKEQEIMDKRSPKGKEKE